MAGRDRETFAEKENWPTFAATFKKKIIGCFKKT